MRKTLYLLLTTVLLACGMARGAEFNNEDLHYVISYKWGLIHKDAGDATLSLRRHGANYNLKLTAKTKPWADRIYKVRDTLLGTVQHLGAGQTRHLTATIGAVVLGLYRVRFHEDAIARLRCEIFSKRRLQLTQKFLQVGTSRRLHRHCEGSIANCVEHIRRPRCSVDCHCQNLHNLHHPVL